jgi:hypothetical protein
VGSIRHGFYMHGGRGRGEPLKNIWHWSNLSRTFFWTKHKNIITLVSVSYESPVCRKSFQTLFSVSLCTQATRILVLQANCVCLTSDLREKRCSHPWFSLYLLTINPCSVPHRIQYSDCCYNNVSNQMRIQGSHSALRTSQIRNEDCRNTGGPSGRMAWHISYS